MKDNVKRMRRQTTECKEIFAKDVSDKIYQRTLKTQQ